MMKRSTVAWSPTQDTSGLSRQCSATEPQQPDNHQPSPSSICTASLYTFRLMASKFIYFQHETRCSEHYTRHVHQSYWALLSNREREGYDFTTTSTVHSLSRCIVVQKNICITYISVKEISKQVP